MSEVQEQLARRYGEKEIGRILKRATELQVAEPSAPNPSGMTLEELEEIAVEAGIDPRYLRRAALELDEPEPGSGWARVVGDQLSIVYEQTVGGELPEHGFERALAVIQTATHDHGQPSMLGRTLTWQAETPSKTRSLMVVVNVRDGETRVRVEERLHQLAAGLFGGMVGGGGLGLGLGLGLPLAIEVLSSALVGVAFPLGIAGLFTVGAREIYRRNVRARRRALSGLMDRLVAEVASCVREGGLEVPTPGRGALGTGDASSEAP